MKLCWGASGANNSKPQTYSLRSIQVDYEDYICCAHASLFLEPDVLSKSSVQERHPPIWQTRGGNNVDFPILGIYTEQAARAVPQRVARV